MIALVGCLALAGLAGLGGCLGDDPRFPPMLAPADGRMPVAVDYYPHQTLHPVPHDRSGRVDPVDTAVGRHRDFGAEPAVAPPPDPRRPPDLTIAGKPRQTKPSETKPPEGGAPDAKSATKPGPGPVSRADPAQQPLRTLLAELRALPRNAAAYMALAPTRKKKTRVAKTEAADDAFDASRDPLESAREQPSRNATGDETADNRGVEDRDGGYRLNFEDAEVKDVLQAVLGHVLGVTYTIAPNISGRITISSSAPQSRGELLATLETVLAMQGLSLTRSGSAYRVTPMSLGGGTLDTTGNEPGFGISVVPLQYSSVASINKLLGGFVTDTDGIRIDSARNAVIVRGPGPRRAEIVRAIKAFDGDWMHSQSVSMFELRRSHPDDLIPELTRIFAADKDGGSEGVIEFKAVKRLRSIMVISKNETLIRRAGSWIRRLDHQDTSETSSIFIYRPRYREARELTKLVNGLFGQADTSAPGASFLASSSPSGAGGSSSGGLSGGSGAGLGSSSQGSSAGLSSASYAGGLSSGGGASAGLGSGGGGSGSSFGTGGSAGSGGLKGELADPVEVSRGEGVKLKLTADPSNNTIVAYTDGETYAKVKAILNQLDIPPLQVAVNVIIAEVQLNDELKYGVQFFLNQSAKSAGSFGFSTSPTSVVTSAAQGAAAGVTQALTPGASGFNFIQGAASPNVIISALDSISKVHILSTPSIVVMENKAATLEVGNQVPVTTQQAQSNLTADAPTVNSVTYLDTGIILKIIPRVGQNGVVDMQIDQEISSVVPDATGSTTASLTPTISKRRIASDISVRSGQNVLLAGLVTDTRSKSNGQVPFVGPQLGNLLGNTDNVFSRNELVMFIRPVIVRNNQDATEVTQDFKRGLNDMDIHPPPVYKP